MSFKNLLIASCLSFVLVSATLAEVPQMINYQGKVTTPQGALIDTTVAMTFSIYPSSTGDTALWVEEHSSVVVEKGIFNVLLGSVVPIHYSIFDDSVRYLV